jgi:hypothetical protein
LKDNKGDFQDPTIQKLAHRNKLMLKASTFKHLYPREAQKIFLPAKTPAPRISG